MCPAVCPLQDCQENAVGLVDAITPTSQMENLGLFEVKPLAWVTQQDLGKRLVLKWQSWDSNVNY